MKKSHAPKSPLVAKVRRNRLITALMNGENLREVAISTGLSPATAQSQASDILRHPDAQRTFIRILEERGLTDEFLAEKAKQLLEAQTAHFFSKDGKVINTRYTPAHETQRKTLELVNRLKGHLKEQATTDVSIGLMQVVLNTINAPDK